MSAPGSFDLLVVGGGPAGSLMALLASRQGMRVLLLERAPFPRPKPCGGVLSPRAVALLARAGVAGRVRAAGAAPIERLRVISPGGDEAILPYAGGLALERAALDSVLLEQAAAAGTWVRTGARVVAAEAGDGPAVRLTVSASAGRVEVCRAPWAAGAGGAHCPLRAWLDARRGRRRALVSLEPADEAVAVSAVFEGPAAAPGECDMHLLGDGYCGVAAAGAGRASVGMVQSASAWRRCGGASGGTLSTALEALPRLRTALDGRRIAAGPWVTGALRACPPRRAAHGVVLIGDALARMEPITGEGMAEALASAHTACRWLALRPDPRGSARLHALLASRGRRARRRSWLAAALSRSPGAARLAVRAAGRSRLMAGLFGRSLAGARLLVEDRPLRGDLRPHGGRA